MNRAVIFGLFVVGLVALPSFAGDNQGYLLNTGIDLISTSGFQKLTLRDRSNNTEAILYSDRYFSGGIDIYQNWKAGLTSGLKAQMTAVGYAPPINRKLENLPTSTMKFSLYLKKEFKSYLELGVATNFEQELFYSTQGSGALRATRLLVWSGELLGEWRFFRTDHWKGSMAIHGGVLSNASGPGYTAYLGHYYGAELPLRLTIKHWHTEAALGVSGRRHDTSVLRQYWLQWTGRLSMGIIW